MKESKQSKLAKQLGFDASAYKATGTGRPGGGNHFAMSRAKEKAEKAFINNNYHVQSAIDHGRATGNKRAEKLSKGSLKSEEDFQKAYKYMKKGHEHAGNGGSFSSHSDMMGSSDYRFDKNMSQMRSQGGGGGDEDPGEADKEPFSPRQKSEQHLQAEANYGDGSFPESNSAVDSYNRAKADAVAAGHDMTAADLARRTSADKMDWITNRFMPYVRDKNELGRHEQQYAASNAIDRAEHAGMEPPSLTSATDLYGEYKDDLDSIG
jgi:hypothetical protein